MYECELDHKEGWAPKNWYFWIVVLEKTLESTLDCDEIKWVSSRGNQLLMFLEGLMLKQKLQYFGHLIRRPNALEKILMLGNTEGKKRRMKHRMRWLDSVTNSLDMNLCQIHEIVKVRKPGMLPSMCSETVPYDLANEQQWYVIM